MMAMAGDVTPEQALEQARSFFQNRETNGSRAKKAPGTTSPTLTMTRQLSGLYVFNVSDDGGFIIVSNDDCTQPILGYSDSGNLNPDNIPENMRAWLQGYADEIDWLKQHHASAAPAASRTPLHTGVSKRTAIEPLVTTTWDQDTPYNNLCPLYSSYSRCATGCVATAMAQAMYYTETKAGNSTTTTTAQIPAYTTEDYGFSMSAIPAGTTINWSNMIADYSSGYTTAQATAVAQLMLYCGCSVEMNYGPSSGAYTSDVASALKAYFNYKNTTQYVVRSLYSYANWMSLIYHELAQGRVVVYGGLSTGGGHEFICDGYKYEQGTDFFHINWGWSGLCDNYFVLSALDPDQQGIGGSSSDDGFHYGQDAVIGIQKPSDNGTVANITPNDIDLSLSSMTLSSNPLLIGQSVNVTLNVTNNGTTDYDGDIFLGCKYYVGGNAYYYLIEGNMFTIPAGETVGCDIPFKPDEVGTYDLVFFIPNGTGSYSTDGNVGATLTVVTPIDSPTDLTCTLTPGNGTVAALSWTENGTATTWQICLDGDEDNLITTTTNPYQMTNLTPEETYTAKVRAIDGDMISGWSDVISFKPTNAYILTVNNGTESNSIVPVYGYWTDKSSKSQFIIPAEDLTDMVYGTINEMTFYASQNTVSWGNAKFEVYVKEVDNTTLNALEDWSSLEKVRHAGTLSISGKQMAVEFDNAYTYMGGNLLVGILQTTSGSYSSSQWYGKTVTGASIGGYDTNISQQNFLPKTSFAYTPGVPPAYPKPTHLTVSEVTDQTATLSWTAPNGENTVTGYAYQYKPANEEEWSDEATVDATTVTIEGLTAMTTYDFRVKALYEGGNESEYAPKSFKTTYETMSLPYNYGFEDEDEMEYWSTVYTANTPGITTDQKRSGSNSFRFSSYSTASSYDQYLISPRLNTPKGVKVRFYYKAHNASNTETFKVGYSTTDAEPSSFHFGNQVSATNTSAWKLYEATFPAGTKYVAVYYYSNYKYYLYVDDFSFTAVTSTMELANDDSEKAAGEKNSNLISMSAGQTTSVTLTGRTLYKDGAWNTICLPFDVVLEGSPFAGATAKTLTDATMTGTHVTLTFGDAVTMLEAGKPYIIKWEEAPEHIVEPVFENVTINATAERTVSMADGHVKFIGYYDAFPITAANDDIYYMTSGSTLKHTGTDRTLKSCRAYFQFTEAAAARQFVLDFSDDTMTTDIEHSPLNIDHSPLNTEQPVYDLQGRRVNSQWSIANGQWSKKGLYIQNGKKVVIR